MAELALAAAAGADHYRLSSSGPVPLVVEVPSLVGLWVGLAGAAVAYSRARGTGSLSADFGYRVAAWWDLPAGAAAGLACQYLLIPLVYLPFERADHRLAHQLSQPATREVGTAHTGPAVAVALLALAVGAPLVEELYFRGLLLRSLRSWLAAPPAVVLTALVFALAHFEPLQFAGLALFGVVLGVLAEVIGRLGPSVGAHVAFNVAAVVSVVHLR